MVLGYNIKLAIGGKTLAGRTKDSLNISAITKESITKDDNGKKQIAVVGHDVTFSVSALMEIISAGEATKLDRDDVIALSLKTGAEAVVTIEYALEGGDTYQGNAVITGYTEDSSASADSDTTVSLNLQVTGDFTKKNA